MVHCTNFDKAAASVRNQVASNQIRNRTTSIWGHLLFCIFNDLLSLSLNVSFSFIFASWWWVAARWNETDTMIRQWQYVGERKRKKEKEKKNLQPANQPARLVYLSGYNIQKDKSPSQGLETSWNKSRTMQLRCGQAFLLSSSTCWDSLLTCTTSNT